MTVRVYQNTDPGAPPLRGNTPGDLLNLLTKCLVDGYGDKPGAGWTRPFVAGNVGVFRQGPGGNDMYLRVDDSSTLVSRRHARVRGFTSMSDIDTGAGPFPNDDQAAGGGYWFVQYNGTIEAADARPWLVIADELFFYLILVNRAGQFAGNGYSETYFFGDIEGYGPIDAFGTVLSAATQASGETSTGTPQGLSLSSNVTTNNNFLFAPRRWDQEGGAVNQNMHSDAARGTTTLGSSGIRYPNGPDNRLYMAPVWIGDNNAPGGAVVRGHLPGLWNPLHAVPFERLNTFTGQADLAGKEFIAWRQQNVCWAIETSDTWRD